MKEIELKTLKDSILVSLPTDSRTRRIIDGAAATAGFAFRHAVIVNQFATLYSFVRNGVGLTIVPDGARPPANDRTLVSRPLTRPRVSRDIGIVRLRDRELSPASAGLLALVKERLGRVMREEHLGRLLIARWNLLTEIVEVATPMPPRQRR
jgi:DNA-binding transcriptional LysR family regulator